VLSLAPNYWENNASSQPFRAVYLFVSCEKTVTAVGLLLIHLLIHLCLAYGTERSEKYCLFVVQKDYVCVV